MTVIARDEYEAVLGERNYALGELRELRQVVAERNAEVERLSRQLAGAVSALRIAEHELSGREDFDPDVRVEVLRMVREAIAAVGGQYE